MTQIFRVACLERSYRSGAKANQTTPQSVIERATIPGPVTMRQLNQTVHDKALSAASQKLRQLNLQRRQMWVPTSLLHRP